MHNGSKIKIIQGEELLYSFDMEQAEEAYQKMASASVVGAQTPSELPLQETIELHATGLHIGAGSIFPSGSTCRQTVHLPLSTTPLSPPSSLSVVYYMRARARVLFCVCVVRRRVWVRVVCDFERGLGSL